MPWHSWLPAQPGFLPCLGQCVCSGLTVCWRTWALVPSSGNRLPPSIAAPPPALYSQHIARPGDGVFHLSGWPCCSCLFHHLLYIHTLLGCPKAVPAWPLHGRPLWGHHQLLYMDDVNELGKDEKDILIVEKVCRTFTGASEAILNRSRKTIILGLGSCRLQVGTRLYIVQP